MLTHEQLHIVVGPLLFVTAAWLFGWRLTSWKPLLLVALFEGANGLLDYTRYALEKWPWQREAAFRQIALTLAGPVVIMLLAAVAGWFRPRRTNN